MYTKKQKNNIKIKFHKKVIKTNQKHMNRKEKNDKKLKMCSQMNKSVINKDKKVKKMSEIIAL